MDERKILEFKPPKKDSNEEKKENDPEKKDSISERYFGGVDTKPVGDIDLEGLPDNIKKVIQRDLENITKSAESFDNIYQKKLKELKDKLQVLKDLVDKKNLSLGARVTVLENISKGEKWIFGAEETYDTLYNRFSTENKATFMGQEIRNGMTESLDKMIESFSVIEKALLKVDDKNL